MRVSPLALAAVAFAACGGSSAPSPDETEGTPLAGKATMVEGSVEVRTARGTGWTPLRTGDEISEGSVVRSLAGRVVVGNEHGEVELSTRSAVRSGSCPWPRCAT